MFRFEEPAYLYLLLLLPLLAAFYLYSNYRRRKAIRKFGDPILMAQLMPDVSKYRPDVKFWLVFAAIGLFTVLLARPQFGSKLETVKRQGVEVMIALDISNSMLAQDVQPSRLQKAKRLVAQLVDKGRAAIRSGRWNASTPDAAQTGKRAGEAKDPQPTPSQRKHQNDLVRKLNSAGKGRAGRKA